jgi:hypothetical protein
MHEILSLLVFALAFYSHIAIFLSIRFGRK